ncbi:hypothetical protein D7D52_23460 [Nocardia yunnanensis]|uniref:Lipid/polyisoprenoid-binding YceI-like domain-containing protein n=1 Tax=Nocardia yunnanensis TaxID=2382165 RepID=A0A386ZGC9_9NOCA|nr:YceI family protein [Nocardia yunnanensis]AYF76293.1 hypothetical protein D7D52_23460 [Nocardia yunnanensis]
MTGLTVEIRDPEGWPVADAVLTVTDLDGHQRARAASDPTGAAATEPLPAGTYTAVVTAPGHQPIALVARVSAGGAGSLGTVRLERATDAVATPPPGPWTIDPAHSTVLATARHLGIAGIKARFAEVGGRLDIAENFEHSTGYAEIKAATVDTGIALRDDHLRSADFLDVDRYPLITFHGKGFRRTAPTTWLMPGDLTLHGRTRPTELTVTYGGHGPDPWGGTRAAFHAETLLHREDFAIDYSAMVQAGIAAVGTTIRIELDIELVQGDRLPAM